MDINLPRVAEGEVDSKLSVIQPSKMMRGSIVFALLLAAVAAHSSYHGLGDYKGHYHGTKTADLDYLHKQKKIYDLLMYVDQNVLTDTEYFEIGRHYDISANLDYYTNKDAVMQFLTYYKIGFLKKDSLFTYYKQEHREEMMMLYRLFYFAKDFNTFYKTASWARIYMNPGMFTTAFTTAVIYRPDTKYIKLPAIYEIYPNMFFDSKVIRDAHRIKMSRGYGSYHGYQPGMKSGENMDSVETFYVNSNYTDFCFNPAYEYDYKLNYFMEDVGLNAYYYYFRMAYPFWMDLKDYDLPKSFRGDFYYFFHKQIMARYFLERFSNDLGTFDYYSWDRIDMPGYYSDLSYFNGVSMPKRDWWNFIPYYKYKYVEYIKKLETRILEAIDAGFFYDEMGKQISLYTPEGLNYLGNLIEGNCDSYNVKYYGAYDVLARDILGQNFDCKCKDYYVPSSLQLFSTSMRDPAFYRLYDRILNFFQKYKGHLKRYTKTELEFNGIRFENVEVDKLMTYFDQREYFINNAVNVESYKEGKSFSLKTWQYYLNYKPFSYKFAINSDKDTKAVMRIFLGPAIEGDKYDDYTYLQNYYQYFFMLDEFDFSLKPGMNNFERHSSESWFFKGGYLTGDKYYKKVLKAIEGSEPFSYSEKMWGFPDHLMLPKGKPEGMRFKLFFYIGPYEEAKFYEIPIFGKFPFYGKSFGYPLDRPMYPWFFKLDNIYFKDVYIYHMKDESKYSHYNQYNSQYFNKQYFSPAYHHY